MDKTDPKLPEPLNLNLTMDEWLGLNTKADRSQLLLAPKLHPPAADNDHAGRWTVGTWHGHTVELHTYVAPSPANRLGFITAKQDALTHDRDIAPMLGLTIR